MNRISSVGDERKELIEHDLHASHLRCEDLIGVAFRWMILGVL
jgi:hypothetical protein